MPRTIILKKYLIDDAQADNPVVNDWHLHTLCNLISGSLHLREDVNHSDIPNSYTVPDDYPKFLHVGGHDLSTPVELQKVNEWNEWVKSDSGWLFYGINDTTLGAYAVEDLPSPLPLSNLGVEASSRISIASLTTHRDIKHLSLNKVNCLNGIEFLSDLQNLKLVMGPGLSSLSPLSGIQSLISLKIDAPSQADHWDLLPLASLNQLEILSLRSFSNQTDYSPIAALKNLHTLSLIYSFECRDFSPLSALAHIIRLDLTGAAGLTDLSVLESMPNLQELNLTCCTSLHNLEPLGSLQKMQKLQLSFCEQVEDLTPLARLPHLRQLSLTDCWKIKPALREAAENGDFNLFRSLSTSSQT